MDSLAINPERKLVEAPVTFTLPKETVEHLLIVALYDEQTPQKALEACVELAYQATLEAL